MPMVPPSLPDPTLEEAIDRLYRAVSDSSGWEAFLQAVCALFAAKVVHFLISEPGDRIGHSSVVWGGDPSQLESFAQYAGQDPRYAVWVSRPNTILADHQILGREVWHASGMFQGFFRPNGMDDNLSVIARLDERTTVGLSVIRPLGAPSFTTGELERFGVLLPHLRRAGQLVLRYLELEGERWETLGVLDQMAMGVVARHNQLWGNTPEQTRRLREAIRLVAEGARRGEGESRSLSLVRQGVEEPLLVRINGLGHNRILGQEVRVGQGVALIYLSDPARPQEYRHRPPAAAVRPDPPGGGVGGPAG